MAYTVLSSAVSSIAELDFRPVGGQPAFEPAELERFVSETRVAVLAYLRADQRPHQAPIWYTYRDGTFFMTTETSSAKDKALIRDPRVSLTIQDDAPPYRAVIMEGSVELSPLDPASDPTAGVAIRYFGLLGAREFEKLTAEAFEASGLTRITFRPTVIRGFDNTKALGRFSLAFIRLRERLPVPRRWL